MSPGQRLATGFVWIVASVLFAIGYYIGYPWDEPFAASLLLVCLLIIQGRSGLLLLKRPIVQVFWFVLVTGCWAIFFPWHAAGLIPNGVYALIIGAYVVAALFVSNRKLL